MARLRTVNQRLAASRQAQAGPTLQVDSPRDPLEREALPAAPPMGPRPMRTRPMTTRPMSGRRMGR